ncbi:hypothetical protein D7V77_34135 [Corallococcus sp. CA041A]|nr:hypothetical protein D7V77_34135 [Corallococcus sp. CA041A]
MPRHHHSASHWSATHGRRCMSARSVTPVSERLSLRGPLRWGTWRSCSSVTCVCVSSSASRSPGWSRDRKERSRAAVDSTRSLGAQSSGTGMSPLASPSRIPCGMSGHWGPRARSQPTERSEGKRRMREGVMRALQPRP